MSSRATGLVCLAGLLLPLAARAQRPAGAPTAPPAAAVDTAHITYRTAEVIFVSAGRGAGISVGDTLTVESRAGEVVAQAVVVSVAQSSASATPVPAHAAVEVGQQVRFKPHVPAAVTSPAAPSPAAPVEAAAPAAPARPSATPLPASARPPAARWRASIQLNQSASSTGGQPSLTTYQTVGALRLTAPLAPWLRLVTRSTTLLRNSTGGLSAAGLGGTTTRVYELAATVGPRLGAWSLTLGRFLPADAVGLGYLDGARFQLGRARGQRLGVVAGYAPNVYDMSPSSQVARAGAFWGVTTSALSASLSGAAEWQARQVRRAWASAQAYWTPSPGLSFSLLTDVDRGVGWESFRGLQLTNLSVGFRTELPFGWHAGLTAESHAALRLYSLYLVGDTLPLPGRLTGFTASLGRRLLGTSVEATAGYLKRASDPAPTVRGTLMLFNRRFMLLAMGQHGPLFDYGAATLRVPLLGRGRLTSALGIGTNVTRLPRGSQTLWRYDLRPELGWRLGGGFYASASADIGRYAGVFSTYLQAGVGYQIW